MTIFIELTQKSTSENLILEIIVFKIIIFEITVFMTETLEIQIDLNLKHIMSNNIIIYNIPEMTIQIISIIDEFLKI